MPKACISSANIRNKKNTESVASDAGGSKSSLRD